MTSPKPADRQPMGIWTVLEDARQPGSTGAAAIPRAMASGLDCPAERIRAQGEGLPSRGRDRGNVKADSLTVLRTSIPEVATVTNPQPGRGGRNGGSLYLARQRAMQELRTRHRAVTVEDFEYLAMQASIRVGRAKCLVPDGGPITVFVLSACDNPEGQLSVRDVAPTSELLEEVHIPRPAPSARLCRRGQTRATTRGHRRVTVETFARSSLGEVQRDIEAALYRYLYPLFGATVRAGQRGWGFGRSLNPGEIHGVIHSVYGVKSVPESESTIKVRDPRKLAGPEEIDGRHALEPAQLVVSGTHKATARPRGIGEHGTQPRAGAHPGAAIARRRLPHRPGPTCAAACRRFTARAGRRLVSMPPGHQATTSSHPLRCASSGRSRRFSIRSSPCDCLPAHLDPKLAPAEALHLMALWLGLPFEEHLPRTMQQRLVENALEISRSLGTARVFSSCSSSCSLSRMARATRSSSSGTAVTASSAPPRHQMPPTDPSPQRSSCSGPSRSTRIGLPDQTRRRAREARERQVRLPAARAVPRAGGRRGEGVTETLVGIGAPPAVVDQAPTQPPAPAPPCGS